MPTDYDAIIAQADDAPAPVPTPDVANPYDDIVQGENPLFRVSTSRGLIQDADRAARILRAQERTRLPADLLDRNLDLVEQEMQRVDFLPETFRDSPVVSQWLSEQAEHTAIAKDDLPRLAEMEALVRSDPQVQFLPDGQILERRGAAGFYFANQAEYLREWRKRRDRQGLDLDEREEAVRELSGAFGPLANVAAGGFQSLTSTLRAVQVGAEDSTKFAPADRVAQASFDINPGLWGDIQRGAGALLADVPLMLTGAPLAKATTSVANLARMQRVLTPTMARVAQGAAGAAAAVQPLAIREGILTGQEHGVWHGLAAWGIETGVPAAFGRTGIERALIGNLDAAATDRLHTAAAFLMREMGMEAAEEVTTELAHALYEVGSGIDPTALDAENLQRRLIVAGVLGAGASAAFNAPEAIGRLGQDVNRIEQARAGKATIEQLMSLAKDSTTRQRYAPGFQALLQKATEAGGVGTVFWDLAQWNTFWQEKGQDPRAMAEQVLEDGELYEEAVATGAALPISLARFTTQMADIPEAAGLADLARFEPDALNAQEGGFLIEDLTNLPPEEAARLQAEAQTAATAGAEADPVAAIRADVTEQLVNSGVEAKTAETQAALWANAFQSLAERFNRDAATRGGTPVDPAQLFEAYRVRIQRVLPEMAAMQRGNVDVVDTLLDRLRTGQLPTESDIMGRSLRDFLIESGGVVDEGTELSTIGVDERRRPFQKKLINANGFPSLDRAAQAAHQAGYIAEATPNALLEALSTEGGAATFVAGDVADPQAEQIRNALLELQDELGRLGVDLNTQDNVEIKRLLQAPPVDVGEEELAQAMSRERAIAYVESDSVPRQGEIERMRKDYARVKQNWVKAVSESEHKINKLTEAAIGLKIAYDEAVTAAGNMDIGKVRDDAFRKAFAINDQYDDTRIELRNEKEFLESAAILAKRKSRPRPGHIFFQSHLTPDISHLSDEGRAYIESLPEADRALLAGPIAYLRNHPDPMGDRGNLMMSLDAAKAMRGRQPELAQSAYHGSPHKFDKFTTDHMGSGEGAQAYGWGLYFAGEKAVAKYYQEVLAPDPVIQDLSISGVPVYRRGDPVDYSPRTNDSAAIARAGLQEALLLAEREIGAAYTASGDVGVREVIRGVIDQHIKAQDPENDAGTQWLKQQALLAQSDSAFRIRIDHDKGRIYTVELPEDGEYLLWDKPITQQPPKVKAALKAAGIDKAYKANLSDFGSPQNTRGSSKLGSSVYEFLSWQHALKAKADGISGEVGPEAASKQLLALGIKGIKYLDGNSRTQGKGSFNYVIFDGADVAIREYEQRDDDAKRGGLRIGADRQMSIVLYRDADLSTFLHESGHFFLEVLGDLAARPDAPADIAADMATALEWMGWTGTLAEWNAADIEARRPHHETWARGFEAYLMEGKAPTQALRGAFARFKAWLVSIYRDMKALAVELTPEVRGVFDRLLASEAEIRAAQDRQGVAPLPRLAFDSDEDFAAYQESLAASTERAETELRVQLMAEERRGRTQAWRDVRRTVRATIQEQIDQRPEYVAIAALQNGTLPDGRTLPDDLRGLKLNKAEIVNTFGEQALTQLPGRKPAGADARANPRNRGNNIYGDEGGLSLQAAADLFGFRDAAAIWEALVNAPDRRQLIEAETDLAMRERFPDPMTDGSIEQRATEAVHGDHRGDLLVREMRALSVRVGQTPAPREALRNAARQAVGRAKVARLRPHRFEAAERAAAQKAQEAAAQGRWADALVAKQRELLNHEMYRASLAAKQEAEVAFRMFRRLSQKPSRERIGKAGGWAWTVTGPDGSTTEVDSEDAAREAAGRVPGSTWERTSSYLDQIDGILAQYEITKVSAKALARRESLAAWLASVDPSGDATAVPDEVLGRTQTKNWRQLTVDELRGVRDALANIEALARHKNQLLAAARQRDFTEARDAAVANLEANVRKLRPERIAAERTVVDQAGDAFGRFIAAHRKVSFIAREADGGADGGAFWEAIVRPMNEAQDREVTMRADSAQAFAALTKAWQASGANSKARVHIPSLGTTLNLETRIMVALNWGNQGNRDAILLGQGQQAWNQQNVDEILATLTDADWNYVEGIWRWVDSFWAEIAAKEQRVTGIAPEKVPADPFRVGDRVVRGGYFPIHYDPALSASAEVRQAMEAANRYQSGAAMRKTTARGHTKQRTQRLGPLMLSLDVIPRHVTQVIHDLTHHEAIIDVNKFLADPTWTTAVRERLGRNAHMQMSSWAGDLARPALNEDGIGKFIRMLRNGVSVSVMGFNVGTALVQVTGIGQSMQRTGVAAFGRAFAQMVHDPDRGESAFAFVKGKSEFMAARDTTRIRDLNEAVNQIQGTGWHAKLTTAAYWMMTKTQTMIDTPTWLAAYETALTQGKDDASAVAIADQVVRDTQGSGMTVDQSNVQRGAVSQLFTVFYSYAASTFNASLNSVAQARNAGFTAASMGKLMQDFVLLYSVPAAMYLAIKYAMAAAVGGEDELKDRDFLSDLAMEHVSMGMNNLVLVRELSGTVTNGFGYRGPAGTRALESISRVIQQAQQGELDRGLGRAGLDAAGVFFRLPVRPLTQILDGWNYAQEQGVNPVLPLLLGKPRQ
jgi:hypothetical protein